LCTGRFAKLGLAFTDADGDSMTVADLQSYTEETLKEHVLLHKGPDGLVPPWLDANSLRPLLRVVEQASPATTATGPQLVPLDDLSAALFAPQDVPLPSLLEWNARAELAAPPPFLPARWLVETVELVRREWRRTDSGQQRKRPMALVRCSRGGKTRALKEMAHQLHRKLPGTVIIFVSFNDLTPVQLWEQADPLGALCRRIAFAARQRPDPTKPLSPKDEMDQFKAFNYAVTPDQIEKWVANTPCILAIDELNLFHRLHKNSFEAGVAFAVFLKVGIGGQAAALSLTVVSFSPSFWCQPSGCLSSRRTRCGCKGD
jgi:hypothetical protein